MNKKLVTDEADMLMDAVLTLKTRGDCYDFFEDLCTVFEIKEFSRRFEVAKMLSEGRSYIDIINKSGLSTATISRVNSCLKYGSGGYVRALEALSEKKK